jgi:hypothetical protein
MPAFSAIPKVPEVQQIVMFVRNNTVASVALCVAPSGTTSVLLRFIQLIRLHTRSHVAVSYFVAYFVALPELLGLI